MADELYQWEPVPKPKFVDGEIQGGFHDAETLLFGGSEIGVVVRDADGTYAAILQMSSPKISAGYRALADKVAAKNRLIEMHQEVLCCEATRVQTLSDTDFAVVEFPPDGTGGARQVRLYATGGDGLADVEATRARGRAAHGYARTRTRPVGGGREFLLLVEPAGASMMEFIFFNYQHARNSHDYFRGEGGAAAIYRRVK